jgi:2'-5' RNA ligase
MAETAIIVPVDPAEVVAGRWRRRYTPSGSKGMPAHVTLLAPFTPPEQLVPQRIQSVSDVLTAFRPFDFELMEAAYLDLGSRRVLYLRPEPAGPFVELIDALVGAFPEHPPYGTPGLEPLPHVTVATSPDDVLLARIEAAVRPALPIRATAAEAWVVEYGDEGCRTAGRIGLGERRR